MTRRKTVVSASWNMNHTKQLHWQNEDLERAELRYKDLPPNTTPPSILILSPCWKVWGCDIIVDWADPQEEPDESTMSKVKVLYVRNLTQEISEEKLKEAFEQYGKVERVKKIKDYAFVHFEDRDHAVLAMRGLDGKEIGCANIEVCVRTVALVV